jgi:hypothetical protein
MDNDYGFLFTMKFHGCQSRMDKGSSGLGGIDSHGDVLRHVPHDGQQVSKGVSPEASTAIWRAAVARLGVPFLRLAPAGLGWPFSNTGIAFSCRYFNGDYNS